MKEPYNDTINVFKFIHHDEARRKLNFCIGRGCGAVDIKELVLFDGLTQPL